MEVLVSGLLLGYQLQAKSEYLRPLAKWRLAVSLLALPGLWIGKLLRRLPLRLVSILNPSVYPLTFCVLRFEVSVGMGMGPPDLMFCLVPGLVALVAMLFAFAQVTARDMGSVPFALVMV